MGQETQEDLIMLETQEYPVGLLVEVSSGDGKIDRGKGTLVGYATVYFLQSPFGSLQSLANAEEEPRVVPPNHKVVKAENNPKIELEDGTIVYGCQVWWQPVDTKPNHILMVRHAIAQLEAQKINLTEILAELEEDEIQVASVGVN